MLKFNEKTTSVFQQTLKARIRAYLATRKEGKYDNGEVLFKAVFFLCIYLSAYFLIIFGGLNKWLMLLLAVLHGMAGAMIMMSVVHDAGHNAIFKNKKMNKVFRYLGDFVGVNTHIWTLRHDVQHHSFTNVAGGDFIVQNFPLLRLCKEQKRYACHRYQFLYAPVMYGLYPLIWVFYMDIKLFFEKSFCNLKNIHHSNKDWTFLFAGKLFYILIALVIPMQMINLPWQQVLAGFIIMHFAVGIMLAAIALPGHFVEEAKFVIPDNNGIIFNNWADHEWEATVDFSSGSRVAHWLTGGLNTHLAHHLFGDVCHCHYFEMTKIIKETAKEYNVYYKNETFSSAILSHFRLLVNMGKE